MVTTAPARALDGRRGAFVRGQRSGATRARIICAPPRRSARIYLTAQLTLILETVLHRSGGMPTPVSALGSRQGAHVGVEGQRKLIN